MLGAEVLVELCDLVFVGERTTVLRVVNALVMVGDLARLHPC